MEGGKVKQVKAQCNDCGQETNHIVLCQDVTQERTGDERLAVVRTHTYHMLKCCGCGTVHLTYRISGDDIVDVDPVTEDWHFSERTYRFPPKVVRGRPLWLPKLRKPVVRMRDDDTAAMMVPAVDHKRNLSRLLEEVYCALDADCRCLATMGARCVVDLVMRIKGRGKGSFRQRLERLLGDGWISPQEERILMAALDVGHRAVHEGNAPESVELTKLMDVIENLLQRVFVLDS